MLKLGHIEYSNCLPVHALLLEEPHAEIQLVHGTPAELNRALEHGEIDVAPCSSIEYARQSGEYRLLPGLVIGSCGPVRSIRLESKLPLEQLHDRVVAVPSASATSVVLLRILFELRYGVRAQFRWFDQETGSDPVMNGAAAALWIGDLALCRVAAPGSTVHDLGELWFEWTGLPFAFALWQTSLGPERDDELRALTALLTLSRDRSLADPVALADRHASLFHRDPIEIARYWSGLRYILDARLRQGLLHYYELSMQVGDISRVPELRFVPS
jgi:chorismate dehydratase